LSEMTPEQYLAQRLQQYIDWYDGKSISAKRHCLQIRAGSVVGAAIVPVLANITLPISPSTPRILTTLVSLGVVILVSLESVFHFGDQWKNYRSTEQFLSREKVLFVTGEGPYRGLEPPRAFSLLVDRCEGQIAAENSATLKVMTIAPQQGSESETKGAPRT
jgi:Protein of unknown function (DUF4231)